MKDTSHLQPTNLLVRFHTPKRLCEDGLIEKPRSVVGFSANVGTKYLHSGLFLPFKPRLFSIICGKRRTVSDVLQK